ncbi:hypothetical protein [Streptomyces sp. NPDC093795]|uniref:hypothetical protein n=1 Tax=Streptomyces sp. NPDC093795 TaxID=3366051 RepID=UPI00382B1F1C
MAVYGLENAAGTPVYVHAKVCVIDDVWASVGSDNINLRSWTHASEFNRVVLDDGADGRPPRDPGGLGDDARRFARDLRLELSCEHVGGGGGPYPSSATDDLCDPARAFDAWHEGGRGRRPPGRLRAYRPPDMSRLTRNLAMPPYHLVVDPDGRPARLRRRNAY